MAKKKRGDSGSTMDALVAYMKSHPNAVYADAQRSLADQGHKIFPIMWGRAQVMLGRVKAKKRGSKAAAAPATPRAATSTGRPRGRPPGSGRKAAARPAASGGSVSVRIEPGDLATWQSIVSSLNGGGKVALQYDGTNWNLIAV